MSSQAPTPPPVPTVANFEASMQELEALVARMEKGDLSLEESLQAYRRGVALYQACEKILKDAELQVRTLADPLQADADAGADDDAGF
ncbi:exodeoxyribonuclease VII small subunit [Thermomonas flagellata]|uniref:exodeoxyribonuclease VII small subunit n=1 Tax=Thermomonas flagellata TaxID=2888524 RepID=UPI001F0485AD|nr:exodeoxyribonuclease VII small subunit [Thermomonas flagellata]